MKFITNTLLIFLLCMTANAQTKEDGDTIPVTPLNEEVLTPPRRHITWKNFIHFDGYDYLVPDRKDNLCVGEEDLETVVGIIQKSFGHGEKPASDAITIYAPYYPAGTKLYKIKNVEISNYIAAAYGEKYYVVFERDRDEKSLDYIRSLDKIFKDKLQKQQEEAERIKREEAERLAANPWPDRVVYKGNYYLFDSKMIGYKQLGEYTLAMIKRNPHNRDVYPKDFQWEEGDGLYKSGTEIFTLKGINPKFYIALMIQGDGYTMIKVHKNEALQDATADELAEKLDDDYYWEREEARKKRY